MLLAGLGWTEERSPPRLPQKRLPRGQGQARVWAGRAGRLQPDPVGRWKPLLSSPPSTPPAPSYLSVLYPGEAWGGGAPAGWALRQQLLEAQGCVGRVAPRNPTRGPKCWLTTLSPGLLPQGVGFLLTEPFPVQSC